MKFVPLICRESGAKPTEAVLIWLAVTASFTLFGLMVGCMPATSGYCDRPIGSNVCQCALSSATTGICCAIAARDQIARVDVSQRCRGLLPVGLLPGSAPARPKSVRSTNTCALAWPELPLTPAQWRSAACYTSAYS